MSESVGIALPRSRPRADDVVWRAVSRRLLRGVPIDLRENGAPPTDGSTGRVTLKVHDPATYREVLKGGSVGLGRTYAAGWWEADDLVLALRLMTRRLGLPSPSRQRLVRLAGLLKGGWSGAAENKQRDRRQVRAHYDLGDEFFERFLDPTLTYSCAYFERPGMCLEEASVAKLDRICRLAELERGDSVVEIGTGWGSFALHAATQYGCSVTTTTVSARQLGVARRRVSEQGLDGQVTVLDLDYRDLRGQYDKVVSIEMIEAVGWSQLDSFLSACAGLLRPGGLLVLQAIVIDDRLYEQAKRQADFIKTDIFPGSCIPSVASILASARRTGALRLVECHDIGLHYAETLARWRERFQAERASISALGFDESFLRLWDFYLAYCEAGFSERRISDVQLVFEAPGARRHRGSPPP